MSKKSFNRKEAIKIIDNRLSDGISRKEILDELSEIYFDRSTLAKMIASIPSEMIKNRYKNLNNILLVLMIFTIIIKVLVGLILFSEISILLIPVAFLLPLISIFFAFEIANYRGYIYRILGGFAIIGMFKTISDSGDVGNWIWIDLAIGMAIAILAFYLGMKMFPNYGLFGPKKDSNGELLLE